mgnify:FL=1
MQHLQTALVKGTHKGGTGRWKSWDPRLRRMRPFILRSLSRYAEKMGHEVAGVALDGAEAVERICEVQPDMVLLDLNMPEKDGIAVIREAYLDRMIPVIIITGHYSELLMNRADIPCVHGYLMKPTSEAQVQAAMRRTK